MRCGLLITQFFHFLQSDCDFCASLRSPARLTKGRAKARQRKTHQIAQLLELPGNVGPECPSPPSLNLHSLRREAAAQSERKNEIFVCQFKFCSPDGTFSKFRNISSGAKNEILFANLNFDENSDYETSSEDMSAD